MLYVVKREGKEKEYYSLDYRDRDWIFDKETLELVMDFENIDGSWIILEQVFGHPDLIDKLKKKTYEQK